MHKYFLCFRINGKDLKISNLLLSIKITIMAPISKLEAGIEIIFTTSVRRDHVIYKEPERLGLI